jgi:hypothetical protein
VDLTIKRAALVARDFPIGTLHYLYVPALNIWVSFSWLDQLPTTKVLDQAL